MVLLEILQAIWFIWPAYTANAFPTVLHGKGALDFGKNFGKNRLLGDSKTIGGTVGGIVFGIFIGLIQMNVHGYLPQNLGLFKFTVSAIVLLSVGTFAGDIVGSFIKRRMNIKPGDPALLLDQLGFLVAALLFVSLVHVTPFKMVIILLIITPIIHLGANIVGYLLKLKKHPW